MLQARGIPLLLMLCLCSCKKEEPPPDPPPDAAVPDAGQPDAGTLATRTTLLDVVTRYHRSGTCLLGTVVGPVRSGVDAGAGELPAAAFQMRDIEELCGETQYDFSTEWFTVPLARDRTFQACTSGLDCIQDGTRVFLFTQHSTMTTDGCARTGACATSSLVYPALMDEQVGQVSSAITWGVEYVEDVATLPVAVMAEVVRTIAAGRGEDPCNAVCPGMEECFYGTVCTPVEHRNLGPRDAGALPGDGGGLDGGGDAGP